MKYYTLNDGLRVPALGLGTYKIEDEKIIDEVINAAFDLGYEYIDTASFYNNEEYIGKALSHSSKKRADYMLATKVWPSAYGLDKTKRSIDESLKKLGTDYIDVIHLHWFGKDFDEAWKVFMDYKDQGIVRSIAVCNFMPEQVEKLLEVGEAPSMDQLESHLFLQDRKTRAFLREKNIKHQAWSPLARTRGGLLDEAILKDIAYKYNKTPAQIALRWNVDQDTFVIPKSVHPKRLRENIDIFDFALDGGDMKVLASLDRRQRFSQDPLDQDWLEKIRHM